MITKKSQGSSIIKPADGTGTSSLRLPSDVAGNSNLPSGVSSFAETMAAWRFYNNPRIEMSELIEPLREHTRQQLLATGAPVVILVHDWSKLSDRGHTSKRDQAQMAQANNPL